MKESDSIDDFSMKLAGLVTNIRELGEEIDECNVVKKLLRAVPIKFLQIASTIEQFGDLDTMTLEETVGSLKSHEERLKGTTDTGGNQLLLTREQWIERENDESKLLLTREEWLKRSYKGGGEMSTQRFRGRDGVRSSRDKSKVRCFKCLAYMHYTIECKNPKREKEVKKEANMAQIPDDEPALLLVEHEKNEKTEMLINEERANCGIYTMELVTT
ncbi:uncharacterized protein LOC141687552 [Apium graveolens]|uniref:uncharacterized protein LOC141687552 n=1 Tax=Apium graveolens TaxID=4045 RepID=UPI003D78D3BF